jgi:glutamate/tyrosine decarboxylase-like PLP-dependent enzyme
MIERIRQLQQLARPLEPDAGERAILLDQVAQYAEAFLGTLSSGRAYQVTENEGRGLYDAPIQEEGIDIAAALDLLGEHVDRPGLNPASPRHLAYIPGGGLYYGALGDYLAAVTNRYATVFFASPGAVRMENMLLNWMGDLIGYPAGRGGNLTSGGSMANLIGLVAARESAGVQGDRIPRAVVYLTEHVHHSVNKALRVIGLAACPQRIIPVDERYRMDPAALEAAVAADRRASLHPWLVAASAGTTNTGSVDPLSAVGDIAQANDLWLHVDGAYGAFFALCEEGRRILQGMEKSDSMVMDPHKTLFLPYGLGAVLVRDVQKLYAAHHQDADYMQDTLAALEEPSPADLSPELTRNFRGLRLWLPLKLVGVAPFRAAVEEKMLLARYFWHRLQEMEGFEVGPHPDLSVVVYRYVPKRGDANEFNQRLIQEMLKDGRVFLSSTNLDGRYTLRLAVVVFRTHLDDIELTLELLREKARWLADSR